jgi:hypothetical protein
VAGTDCAFGGAGNQSIAVSEAGVPMHVVLGAISAGYGVSA